MFNSFAKRAVLGLALSTGALPAYATETIKAVVIDGYPARALWVQEFTNFFIPEVDKRLAETGNYQRTGRKAMAAPSSSPRACSRASSSGWATSAS